MARRTSTDSRVPCNDSQGWTKGRRTNEKKKGKRREEVWTEVELEGTRAVKKDYQKIQEGGEGTRSQNGSKVKSAKSSCSLRQTCNTVSRTSSNNFRSDAEKAKEEEDEDEGEEEEGEEEDLLSRTSSAYQEREDARKMSVWGTERRTDERKSREGECDHVVILIGWQSWKSCLQNEKKKRKQKDGCGEQKERHRKEKQTRRVRLCNSWSF